MSSDLPRHDADASSLGALFPRLTPLRAALFIALCALIYGVVGLRGHGITSDSPGLFYAGDRTLYWLGHLRVRGALDFNGPEPADFHSEFTRFPDWVDPLHYPVFPSLLAAITSRIFHDKLGLLDVVDGHHLGLVCLHVAGLFFFCLYACRLLGRGAGIAATVALALYPSGVGHSFNNAKDWPCALFYGTSILALGLGVVQGRLRDFFAASVFVALALSSKVNAVFALVTVTLWLPFAYRWLYGRHRPLTTKVVGGLLSVPYVSFAVFFALWPWLYQGPVSDWLGHLNDYVSFMLKFGVGHRPSWSIHSVRCVVFMTPPLVLFAACAGLVLGGRGNRQTPAIHLLLIFWLGLPLLRIAVPNSNYYDANRHFIEYVPALCALAGVGAHRVTERVWARVQAAPPGWLRAPGRAAQALSLAMVIAFASVASAIATHRPYEVAYFNALVGGLGRAQRIGLFATWDQPDFRVNGSEGDYWWSSVRVGLRTIRAAQAAAGKVEPIGLCGPSSDQARVNWSGEPKPPFVGLGDEVHYIYASPREWFCAWAEVRRLEQERVVIERVERGGGLIYEIFGAKRPTPGPPISPPTLYTQPDWYHHPGLKLPD